DGEGVVLLVVRLAGAVERHLGHLVGRDLGGQRRDQRQAEQQEAPQDEDGPAHATQSGVCHRPLDLHGAGAGWRSGGWGPGTCPKRTGAGRIVPFLPDSPINVTGFRRTSGSARSEGMTPTAQGGDGGRRVPDATWEPF